MRKFAGFCNYLQEREEAKYPDHMISITVKNETSDSGRPSAVITRIRETQEEVVEY